MKILFLSSRLPYPVYGGDRITVYNYLKYLSKKHSLTLLTFIEDKKQLKYKKELEKYCAEIETVYLPSYLSYLKCGIGIFSRLPFQIKYYSSKKMREKILDKINTGNYDIVISHLIRMEQYSNSLNGVYKIALPVDAISLSLWRSLRYRNIFWKMLVYLEFLKVRRYEEIVLKNHQLNIVVSGIDKKWLLKKDHAGDVLVVSNGVGYDENEERRTKNEEPVTKNQKRVFLDEKAVIVFLGNMNSWSNQDAVKYFLREIFPLILKEIAEVRFCIVGANVSRAVGNLEGKNITVIGEVKNLKDILEYAKVSVCPLRAGAGIQNKILESMAMGVPVVSTGLGYEGISADIGKAIFVTDKPEEFASLVVRLIKDNTLRAEVGQKGREYIKKYHNWQSIFQGLEKEFSSRVKRD
ncbi:MAG: glycosyltransferase [bacterium]